MLKFLKSKLLAALFVGVLAVGTLPGCATQPHGDVQTVYVAEQALTQAVNGLVAAHGAGILVGDRYEAAKKVEKTAKKTLLDARVAARKGDASTAETLLTAFNSLLTELATYKEPAK